MNPLWHSVLGFVIGVLGFISWMGSGVVMYIFATTKSVRTPSNLLVVNLAPSQNFWWWWSCLHPWLSTVTLEFGFLVSCCIIVKWSDGIFKDFEFSVTLSYCHYSLDAFSWLSFTGRDCTFLIT